MYKWTADFEKDRTEFENKLKHYKDKVVIIKAAADRLILGMNWKQ